MACSVILQGTPLTYIIHLMYSPRETVSFVFPGVLIFPETKSRETSGLKGTQN